MIAVDPQTSGSTVSVSVSALYPMTYLSSMHKAIRMYPHTSSASTAASYPPARSRTCRPVLAKVLGKSFTACPLTPPVCLVAPTPWCWCKTATNYLICLFLCNSRTCISTCISTCIKLGRTPSRSKPVGLLLHTLSGSAHIQTGLA